MSNSVLTHAPGTGDTLLQRIPLSHNNVENNSLVLRCLFVCLFLNLTSPAEKTLDFEPHFPEAWGLQQKMRDLNKGTNVYPAKHARPFKNGMAVWSHVNKHLETKGRKYIWNGFPWFWLGEILFNGLGEGAEKAGSAHQRAVQWTPKPSTEFPPSACCLTLRTSLPPSSGRKGFTVFSKPL